MATAVIAQQRTRADNASSVSTGALVRLSGIAAILAGVLIAFFPILHPNHDSAGYVNPIWIPVHYLPAVSMILAVFGLFGLLARQLVAAGRLGVVGCVVAVVGSELIITGTQVEAFIIPFVGVHAPQLLQGPPPPGWPEAGMLGFLVLTIGYVVLGIATFRAGILPRGAAVLLAIGGVGLGFGWAVSMFLPQALVVGALMFGLSLAYIGYALWSDPRPGQSR
jgi:hypothetical protein